MATKSGVTIKGLEEIQEASRKLVYAANPRGALGQSSRYATLQLMRAVRTRAHVLTGAYRAGITASYDGAVGRVYVQGPAAEYAQYEEARGGSHAAFASAYNAEGKGAAQSGIDIIVGALP